MAEAGICQTWRLTFGHMMSRSLMVRLSFKLSLQWSFMNCFSRINRLFDLCLLWLERNVTSELTQEDFERNHAFRWEPQGGGGRLIPITQPLAFDLADLVGVEKAVQRLVANTEQFLRGLPFNHVLLYGERGTGKSSAVRGLLSRYADRDLRVIEVHKVDLANVANVLIEIREVPFNFILFCDDLSFDEGESGYRELKAALEGSLEAPPSNVCIIATSNRRHLIPQRKSENLAVHVDEDGDLHPGEALEEKLALSDRFGLALGFYSFNQEIYLSIVRHYVDKVQLDLNPEKLRQEALKWALDRSSRSGRTAKQFVDDLVGRNALG